MLILLFYAIINEGLNLATNIPFQHTLETRQKKNWLKKQSQYAFLVHY